MNKFSKKIVFDYINGNDIEDFDIDELENNYLFMIEVINCTNDKKIYELCSDNVKNNYEFVKFLIDKFNKDYNFVIKVADNYLNNTNSNDETDKLELYILLHNILNKTEDIKYYEYSVKVASEYTTESIYIWNTIRGLKDENIKNEIGMGFIFIKDKYDSSKIIKDYFAKRMINEIFYENEDLDFEKIVHEKFKSVDHIKDIGENTFLINYINCYDMYLSNYVSKNIFLLSDIKKTLNRIYNNWNNYDTTTNIRKINTFYYELDRCINKYNYALSFNSYMLLTYILDKFNLKSFFEKYDLSIEIYNEFEKYNKGTTIDINKLNINEIACINEMLKISKNIFKKNILDEDYSDYDTKEIITKKKVINVDFKKKNITNI